jgi:hypothetical protein
MLVWGVGWILNVSHTENFNLPLMFVRIHPIFYFFILRCVMILNSDFECCDVCGELVDINYAYWVSIPSVPLCFNCYKENNGEE